MRLAELGAELSGLRLSLLRRLTWLRLTRLPVARPRMTGLARLPVTRPRLSWLAVGGLTELLLWVGRGLWVGRLGWRVAGGHLLLRVRRLSRDRRTPCLRRPVPVRLPPLLTALAGLLRPPLLRHAGSLVATRAPAAVPGHRAQPRRTNRRPPLWRGAPRH